jgi:hypothetical protein
MKYVAFWTIQPEHMEKAIEAYSKVLALKPDQGIRALFPESLSENYSFCGQNKGFQIYEVENPDQITAVTAYYNPYIQFEFIPIDHANNAAKTFMEAKKMKE